MKFEITQQQVQAIVNYLITRPYGEVHEGVNLLRNLPVIQEVKAELKAVPAEVESELSKLESEAKSAIESAVKAV